MHKCVCGGTIKASMGTVNKIGTSEFLLEEESEM